MRFLIMLEQTEAGFSVQVPDLVIATHGPSLQDAKRAAIQAIRINLDAYREAAMTVPPPQDVSCHLANPDFEDLLFADVDLVEPHERLAAEPPLV